MAAILDKFERRGNHGLGLGTWNQHRGRHLKFQRVEFLVPENICERLTTHPPRYHCRVTLASDLVDFSAVGYYRRARTVACGRQHRLGVEPGIFDTGGREFCGPFGNQPAWRTALKSWPSRVSRRISHGHSNISLYSLPQLSGREAERKRARSKQRLK